MSGASQGSGRGDSERPARPQYGEYATPEEQRAAIREPSQHQLWTAPSAPLDAPADADQDADGVEHGDRPALGVTQPDAGAAAPVAPPFSPVPPVSPAPPAFGETSQGPHPGVRPARPRGADRLATFVLLGLGLFETLQAVTGASGYADTAVEAMRIAGVSGVTAGMLPGWLGYAIAAINVVLWIVALWLSVLSLRRGRLTFWIPLSAGAAASIIGGVLMFGLLLANPDFVHLL